MVKYVFIGLFLTDSRQTCKEKACNGLPIISSAQICVLPRDLKIKPETQTFSEASLFSDLGCLQVSAEIFFIVVTKTHKRCQLH